MKKILFWGTPKLTWTLLDSLSNAGFTPTLIGSTPDAPQGRKLILTPPEIKGWADAHAIEIIQPEKLDDALFEKLSQTKWDLFIVVAYGKIIPERFIHLPKYGTINVHYSLLPKYRGATPVESAILHGDEKTGVSIQQMEYALDTGPVLNKIEYQIPKDATALVLRETLNTLAAPLLVQTVEELFSESAHQEPQDAAQATHCRKIKKEDGLIDPHGDPIQNDRKYRAYTPWPGIYYFEKHGNKNIRVKITDAVLKEGVFTIKKVIPEGKKEMEYTDFLRGLKT